MAEQKIVPPPANEMEAERANKALLDEYIKLAFTGERGRALRLLHNSIKDMELAAFARSVSDPVLSTKERAFSITISFPCRFDEPESNRGA